MDRPRVATSAMVRRRDVDAEVEDVRGIACDPVEFITVDVRIVDLADS